MRRLTLMLCLALVPSLAMAEQAPLPAPPVTLDHPFFQPFLQAQSFDCSNKTCGQMSSCAEACHKLLVCGHTRRDGDGDGIPCESLCSSRC